MRNVPRIGRVLDLVGLVLFLVGAALYARAWVGFRGVSAFVPQADGPAWSAVAVANRFWRLQKIGAGVMLAGLAVFVLAWWVARAAHRQVSATEAP